MKRTFYTMLLATALSLPASYASADSLGLGSTLSGQVGVSAPIVGNTNVQTNTRVDTQMNSGMNSNVDTRARANYRSDSNERAVRERAEIDSRTRTIPNSTSTSSEASVYSANELDQTTVRNIQKTLNDRGYNVGNADGRWGTSTASQLRRFEQNQGLAVSSGTNLNAQSLQQLGVTAGAGARVNTINPAAGNSRNIPPSVRAGVTGSTSYNE